MTAQSAPDGGQVTEIAHLTLQLGRLLLQNGAETSHVQDCIQRFAAAFGCESNLLVSYEALLVTIAAGDHFRTKVSHRVPGMNVGMAALRLLDQVIDQAESGRLSPAEARAGLDAIETRRPDYARWLVAVGLAATAASLSRLFGGDWGAFIVAGVAGGVETCARLELAARRINPILTTFLVALLGGVIGGIGVRFGATAMPALCLVVPGMILVPGVPLINGVRDMMGNHVTLGISRIGFALMVVFAIAIGLFAATLITGVRIPVDAPTRVIGVPEDAVFSAIAGAGYAILFSVPGPIVWACMICAIVSHSLRTLLFHLGIDIIAGTLIGALAVGLLAQGFSHLYRAPAVAFAFAGVVAMIPGVYAFRAVIASVEIAHGGAGASLYADALSLAATVILMVGAIGVGVAAPALVFPSRQRQALRTPSMKLAGNGDRQ